MKCLSRLNITLGSEDTEAMAVSSGHVGVAVFDNSHADLRLHVYDWLGQRS